MNRKLKVWWHGDAGVSTGFGRVTHHFLEGLMDRGFDVHSYAINWMGDMRQIGRLLGRAEPARRWPRPDDVHGKAWAFESISRYQPDVAVLFNDMPVIMELQSLLPPVPQMLYFPVDCADLPPWWLIPVRVATSAYTFSNHGVREMRKIDPTTPVGMIPHAINAEMFYPISERRPGRATAINSGTPVQLYTREEARAYNGVAGKFVVLWADRNSIRKNARGFLAAALPFLAAHPDVLLWMHCKSSDEGGDLNTYINKLGIQRRVRFSPQQDTMFGVNNDDLNMIYNIADVRVSTSLGEGFGLIGGEVAAAGTPQILPTFTCFEEVAGPGAHYVPSLAPYYTHQGTTLMQPDEAVITAELERVYALSNQERRAIGKAGREHVIAHFDPERTIDLMATAIEDAANRQTKPLLYPLSVGA